MSAPPRGSTAGWRDRWSRPSPHGYVTAETALALPVLALTLTVALWGLRVTGAQVRCVDAAREAARSAARGDPPTDVRRVAAGVAPARAAVSVRTGGGLVRVQVRARVPGPLGIGAVTVAAVAASSVEPGQPPPAPGAGALSTGTGRPVRGVDP